MRFSMASLEILFIATLFLSLYSYILYPLLLVTLRTLFSRQWNKGNCVPTMTVIISAYNEEKDIEDKIRNTLLLDYPKEKVEIVVSSDGSTDRTNEIVSAFKDNRVCLKAFSSRMGKTACLNRVVSDCQGEIVVFTDANAMFETDLLQRLGKNFYDRSVGAVSGWTKYFSSGSGEEITGLYAKMEKRIKLDESMISSCVGADGAIFAIRKELYVPLGPNDINDFIIPLNVIKRGKRVVLDEDIYCVEEATSGAKNIFSRQVRITTRTAWAIRRNISLLNIFKYKCFSFFLLSHKVLRLLTPFFLLSTFCLNLFLVQRSPFFVIFMGGQLFFWLTSLVALWGIAHGRIAAIFKYFLITFSAQLVGCLRMIAGIEDIMWTPKR